MKISTMRAKSNTNANQDFDHAGKETRTAAARPRRVQEVSRGEPFLHDIMSILYVSWGCRGGVLGVSFVVVVGVQQLMKNAMSKQRIP